MIKIMKNVVIQFVVMLALNTSFSLHRPKHSSKSLCDIENISTIGLGLIKKSRNTMKHFELSKYFQKQSELPILCSFPALYRPSALDQSLDKTETGSAYCSCAESHPVAAL
jgi:hypothetical protein